MATTAFQTIRPLLARGRGTEPGPSDAPRERPALLDTCHAYAADGDLVRRKWPAFYTGAPPDARRDARSGAESAGCKAPPAAWRIRAPPAPARPRGPPRTFPLPDRPRGPRRARKTVW